MLTFQDSVRSMVRHWVLCLLSISVQMFHLPRSRRMIQNQREKPMMMMMMSCQWRWTSPCTWWKMRKLWTTETGPVDCCYVRITNCVLCPVSIFWVVVYLSSLFSHKSIVQSAQILRIVEEKICSGPPSVIYHCKGLVLLNTMVLKSHFWNFPTLGSFCGSRPQIALYRNINMTKYSLY